MGPDLEGRWVQQAGREKEDPDTGRAKLFRQIWIRTRNTALISETVEEKRYTVNTETKEECTNRKMSWKNSSQNHQT